MKAICLKPLDTFFFRNHQAFDAGQESVANGIFPPRPGTIFGALRSAYIHENGKFQAFINGSDPELKRWMGTPEINGKFTVRGVFFDSGEELFLPLPLDYQVVRREKNGLMKDIAFPLLFQKKENDARASVPSEWRLYGASDEKSVDAVNAYLPLSLWKEALLHRSGEIQVRRPGDWLVAETKTGIARDRRSGKAREKMLYHMEMHRFTTKSNDTGEPGFCALCDDAPDFSNILYATCGHGNRPWKVNQKDIEPFFNSAEKEQLIALIKSTGIARIVLLSPAIWKHGSRPANFSDNMLHFKPKDSGLPEAFSVEILTAALGRPLIIGGWDMVKLRPKPRMYAVPAGSVLYVRVSPEDSGKLVNTLEHMKLTDALAHEGYGFAVCGYYKN